MKTKPGDVPYCGVRREVIEKAEPVLNTKNLVHLANFIHERYLIHYRKDVQKKPAPWTKDFILSRYKFTNVFREDDRVSRELLRLVTHNDRLTYRAKVLNTFLFRSWNNPRTFTDLGGPWSTDLIYDGLSLKDGIWPKYKALEAAEPNRLWWSSAYNQAATKCVWRFPDGVGRVKTDAEGAQYPGYEPNIPLRVFHIGPYLKEKRIFSRLNKAADQKEAYEIISEIPGFAKFLSYQVFVDLAYISDFPFSENEFTIAGPGCRRGLDLVFKDYDGMTYEEALFFLRDNIDDLFVSLQQNGDIAFKWEPQKLFKDRGPGDRCLNVMSLENCFCELSKYVKAVTGNGRPRNTYKPYKEKEN